MGRPKGSVSKGKNGQTQKARAAAKKKKAPGLMSEEITIILTFAASVFLFLSNLGLCGPFGMLLKGIQLGLFGTVGYLFPVVLCFAVVFVLSNANNRYAAFKMTAALFMLIFLAGLIQLWAGGEAEAGLLELYRQTTEKGAGGGVVGGALAVVLTAIVGQAGAVLLLLIAVLICLVYVTEKPLMRMLALSSLHAAEKAGEKAREDFGQLSETARSYRERRRQERAERERLLQERREARGVDFQATDLSEKAEEQLTAASEELRTEAGDGIETESVYQEEAPASSIPVYIAGEPAEEDWMAPLEIRELEDIPAFGEDDMNEREGAGEIEEGSEEPAEETAFFRSPEEDGPDAEKEESVLLRPSGLDPETGRRAVVTAGGKIIESDAEQLRKRIENKRAEATTDAENEKLRQEIQKKKKPARPYRIPPLSLLRRGGAQDADSREEIQQNALTLQQTLKSFGVGVTVTNVSVGPAVTRYELQPEQGVKVSRIVALTNDIKMRLAAADIRIEAPIPGKSAVGIEVPNKKGQTVYLGDIFSGREFREARGRLIFGVGKDIAGKTVVTDIGKMPHLLIAGATGSGKSVSINTLIMSVLYKYKPEEVRMIMVDPKVVELQVYNGIPHLLIPVVTDPKKAAAALNWAVAEMTDRYKKFAETGVRDLRGYNERVEAVRRDPSLPEEQRPEKLPQILIIIDELADLMMVSAQEVEDAICRIAQLARACGMHLVIATQRPSVNVITGLIKANVPSRIAFAVSSGVDSRTIIDMNGAEKLLGKGDMLFFPQGIPKPVRVQGAFVSDEEVQAVVDFLKDNSEAEYSEEISSTLDNSPAQGGAGGAEGRDELFAEAGALIIEAEKASIGMLQRKFRVGFNRAARIMDQLAESGVVGPEEGTKPRRILMTIEEFDELLSG